jgi:integrase
VHLRRLLAKLEADGKAPRTRLYVYVAARQLLLAAEEDEVIAKAPRLPREVLSKLNVDGDPTWRETAIFTRTEYEQLLSDLRLELDRRVLYGVYGFGGMRRDEALLLKWQDWGTDGAELGFLMLWKTKTNVVRKVPVHPTLAAILAEWKLAWAVHYGRQPQPEDYILPHPDCAERKQTGSVAWHHWADDLKRIGLRHRRLHDIRRTMISLAREDGADKDALKVHTDFRRIYATVLDRWLGLESEPVLGGRFEPVDVLKA